MFQRNDNTVYEHTFSCRLCSRKRPRSFVYPHFVQRNINQDFGTLFNGDMSCCGGSSRVANQQLRYALTRLSAGGPNRAPHTNPAHPHDLSFSLPLINHPQNPTDSEVISLLSCEY
jgi:hypothetical protein